MRTFQSFMKKEWLEQWRTWKFPLLFILFVFLGILNPLTALLTPDLLEMVMGDQLLIDIPDPVSLDSWMQFFKNVPQLGLVVFVLVQSGIVNKEVADHTLVNIVTKGAKRSGILLSKLVTLLFQWTVFLIVAYLLTWFYTEYYFTDQLSQHTIESTLLFWLFGVFVTSLLLLGSTTTQNGFAGVLIIGGVLLLLLLANFFNLLMDWNPLLLVTKNMALIRGEIALKELTQAVMSSVCLSLIAVVASLAIFKKKKL